MVTEISYTETDWEKEPNQDVFVKKIKAYGKYEAHIVITGFEILPLYKRKKDQTLHAMKDLIERKENLKDVKLIEDV
jgi:hypothetical protein